MVSQYSEGVVECVLGYNSLGYNSKYVHFIAQRGIQKGSASTHQQRELCRVSQSNYTTTS